MQKVCNQSNVKVTRALRLFRGFSYIVAMMVKRDALIEQFSDICIQNLGENVLSKCKYLSEVVSVKIRFSIFMADCPRDSSSSNLLLQCFIRLLIISCSIGNTQCAHFRWTMQRKLLYFDVTTLRQNISLSCKVLYLKLKCKMMWKYFTLNFFRHDLHLW